MDNKNVLYSIHEGITTITLNRPYALNSMNAELIEDLSTCLNMAATDESRVIILTGNGRGFCAGGDLAYLSTLNDSVSAHAFITKVGRLVQQIQSIDKPIIAMVNGVAAGAGFNLALACDIVYASQAARFAQSFAKVGLVPDCAGMYLLPRIVGMHKAKELMFTADLIDSKTAERMGLVNKVIEDSLLQSETYAFAKILKNSAPLALAFIKKTINASDSFSLDHLLAQEAALQAICMQTEDYQEGISAFKEKRAPLFTGK